MRIDLMAGLLATLILSSLAGSAKDADQITAASDADPHEAFFARLAQMMPDPDTKADPGSFVIESAEWIEGSAALVVQGTTTYRKGTLLTLGGLPASTMVDSFSISRDHRIDYVIPVTDGQAIPCEALVRSVYSTTLVEIANAPAACQYRFEIAGIVDTLAGATGPRTRVTAEIDGRTFAGIVDDDGYYAVELYAESVESRVTLTAQDGSPDTIAASTPLYAGTLGQLLDARARSATDRSSST